MIAICANCQKTIGEKEPFEDTRVTHGICPGCLKVYIEELVSMGDGGASEEDELAGISAFALAST